VTRDALRTLLNINKSEANKLMNNYPVLAERDVESLGKQLKYLSENYCIGMDQFINCPWLLYLPLNFIIERLNSLTTIDITNHHLVLLLLPLSTFQRLSSKIKRDHSLDIYEDFNKRLNYFTTNLNINHEEFCDLIHDNTFLFNYDFKRLEDIMQLLIEANIDPELIVGDIRIFTHNIQVMRSRVQECNQYGMPIKTWMLRSAHKEFYVSLTRHIENKRVLKDHQNNI